MSIKHVKRYYKEMGEQYKESLDALKELEEAYGQGMIDPDKIEGLKKTIDALLVNYRRVSYIMFLLDMPNKEKKEKRYINQNKRKLNDIGKEHTLESIKKENKDVLKNLRNSSLD